MDYSVSSEPFKYIAPGVPRQDPVLWQPAPFLLARLASLDGYNHLLFTLLNLEMSLCARPGGPGTYD